MSLRSRDSRPWQNRGYARRFFIRNTSDLGSIPSVSTILTPPVSDCDTGGDFVWNYVGIEQGKGSRLRSASDGQAGKQLVPSKSREEFSRGGKAPKARVKTAGF